MRHVARAAVVFITGFQWSLTTPANGQVALVDHEPYIFGAYLSDTDYLSIATGQPTMQTVGDNFMLTQSAAIRRIVWWGGDYYDAPSSPEDFRVRFYATIEGQFVPGVLLKEYALDELVGAATGRQFAFGVQPDEYRFEVDLPAPFWAQANSMYWIEIAQLGNRARAFAWEYSISPGYDGLALNSPQFADWLSVPTGPDLAFQLWSVPEPATLGLMVIGAWIARRRR